MDRLSKKSFIVLKEDDIRQRLADAIVKVSDLLSASSGEAIILLSRFNWSPTAVSEEWFSEEDKIRKISDTLQNLTPGHQSCIYKKKFFCGICLENISTNSSVAATASCSHTFCKTCWKSYINQSINDGPGCLTLRCPEPSCSAAICEDTISSLASEKNKKKYDNYLIRSFVESRKNIKWCPGPGCDCAIEFQGGSSLGCFDVICNCSHRFCWNCLGEAHSPVDCKTMETWTEKNNSEEENTNWKLCNTKPCPKCKRPVEKNQGCMHMTCYAPCKFHFCWLCLGAWSEHNSDTGGYYDCSYYMKAKEDGVYVESERKQRNAEKHLKRYTRFHERWASNDSSMKRAFQDMKQLQNVDLEKLSEIQAEPVTQLQFIIDAWVQIVECRRTLKWSYAYGYYLPEKGSKTDFFEYLQGEAGIALERLHHCAEKDLFQYLQAECRSQDFNDFRTKLVGLTKVTKTYFYNLVRALENDLSDVESRRLSSRKGTSKKFRGI